MRYFARALLRRPWLLSATLTLAIAASGMQASANVTGQVCDADSKYYCFSIDYTPNSGFVAVNTLNYTGGRGGASLGFQRYITALWRQDPSTGTWYNLRNNGGWCVDQSLVWCTDASMTAHNYSYGGYYVSDWADVQARDRHQNDIGGFFCSDVLDFHLSSPSGVWIEHSGSGGPC